MPKEIVMEGLNPRQQEALMHTEGPLLILAGAGSGKTRVISYKFVHLMKAKKLPLSSIFAVTFTNKAANEMKERIATVSGKAANGSWIGTFHSQCSKILRREIGALDYKPDFSIYDDDDQCALIRHILREFKFHEAIYKGVAAKISSLKAAMIGPDEFLASGDGFGFDERLARVYMRYQNELKKCNAVDFDDLICLTSEIFEKHPAVLRKYRDAFPYLLVDEFQDTNCAQYKFIRLLASGHNNISVVGDDDQSIYRFRGADVTNVFRFEKDFPKTKVIRLEQNYRSTQHILDAASAVISKNPVRKSKKLWTDRGHGERVYHSWLNNENEESRHIAKTIKELFRKGEYEYRDFAVLYRVNIQSRAIEEVLREEGIPYRIIGGISFYQRKEIKDLIAYMRLVLNHNDNISLKRIINYPARGIGAAVLSKLENEAKKKSSSLYDAVRSAIKTGSVTPTVKGKLSSFVKLIEGLASGTYKTAADMIRDILGKTGFMESIDEDRVRNINELVGSAAAMDTKDFVDKASLLTNLDDSSKDNAVSLMTLHSAKGLEFPVVFIAGLEEGLLPYFKAMDREDEINEERRLFYVGITRARDILWLTGVCKRRLYSKIQDQEPSRFLADIPATCCERIAKTIIHLSPGMIKRGMDFKKPVFPYVSGCRVKHPKWGVGVVRDCYGDGEEQKIMINFPNIGIKKLVLRFANLEKI